MSTEMQTAACQWHDLSHLKIWDFSNFQFLPHIDSDADADSSTVRHSNGWLISKRGEYILYLGGPLCTMLGDVYCRCVLSKYEYASMYYSNTPLGTEWQRCYRG